MKNRNGICRVTALVLVLAILMFSVSRGDDGNISDTPEAVYSNWLRLDELELQEDTQAPAGRLDLSPLLREAALLDAQGNLLAEDGVWSVEANTVYQVRLRFQATTGKGSAPFGTEDALLVYRLPHGLSLASDNLTLPVRIGLDSGEAVEAVCSCDATEGTLCVQWAPGTSAEEGLPAAGSALLEVVFPAAFGDAATLAFSDRLSVSLRRPQTASLLAKGTDYTFFLTGTEKAGIPGDAQLAVTELSGSDARYRAFLEAGAQALGCRPEDLTCSRLFDITLSTPDGAAVKPGAPVQVRIAYAQPLVFETAQRFLVIHLAQDGPELLVPGTEGTEDGGVTAITFEAEAFSPYGVASSPLPALRAGAGQSNDLADFLDSIVITGAEINQGQYVIHEGVPYTIQMHFSEKTNSVQFAESGTLVYPFPDGFTPLPSSGTLVMAGTGGDMNAQYEITERELKIHLDKTSPGYQAFVTSETAAFEVHATGIINQETIEFSAAVSGVFDIDDSHEVSVEKTSSYDAQSNRIRFTIQAHSTGNNTDVHIGDIVSGTALTYDPGSLKVSSNSSNPVTYRNDTRTGETFGVTIPAMAHGETVTIEYDAAVDLSSLTRNGDGTYGTIEQTGNTVNIVSHEDPVPETKTVFENHIAVSTNSKTASSPTVQNGKTYVTWTIVLNENANISIAGSRVTDAIEDASQPFMRYAGSGIHIEKYEKDGTSAGSSDIPWGTGGLSQAQGGSTWTYTIPESDAGKNYRYVITYETEVDSDDFLKPTTVSNTVGNEYDKDGSGVIVDSTGETVEAEKTAVHSTVDKVHKEAETEWEITLTVPADGLDSAVITDTLPAIRDNVHNKWLYDTYKDGSVRVRDGELLSGEAFTVDATSVEHQVIISFTKNNGQPGLTGIGQTRTLHVYLTTQAGSEWLEYAETLSRARNHVNHAIVKVNGQDIAVQGTATYNTTDYELEKAWGGTYATNTAPALPIYVYKIILSNVNEHSFDEDGCIVITDTYDKNYLSFNEQYSTDYSYEVNRPNGYIFGNTQYNKGAVLDSLKGSFVVDPASSEEGRLVFRVNKNELPRLDVASYYPYYTIAYALQVKNAETLARMKEEALRSNGLKVELKNTAENELFGTHTIVTDYTVKALEKTLLKEEDNSNTGTHDLRFQVTVNEQELKIGDQNTITVKDTLSNLSFDYTSIDIWPQREGDSLDRTGNSLVFTLHNETKYVITYTARLVGIHDVQWNNKAELYGYTSGASGTSSSSSGGSGSYQNYSMNVKKYAEGNMNQGLAATFELYEARVKDQDGNDIAAPDWVKVGEFTTDNATGLYSIQTIQREGSSAGRSLRPYSYHDADGTEKFSANYGWRYRIIEKTAPEGYMLIREPYEFGISDIPSYTAPYTYLNDDTITIVNRPVGQDVETVISGTKILRGKELEDQEFTFSLRPEESMQTAWGEGYPGGFDGFLTAANDEDGRFSFSLAFTYDDYIRALEKGFGDADHGACFYYVVTEILPEGAEDNTWNGVRYDDSRFLVRVRLYMDGGQLKTEVQAMPYDGSSLLTKV